MYSYEVFQILRIVRTVRMCCMVWWRKNGARVSSANWS